MTVRLLTNIGRLWTGSEIVSNAAVVTNDELIAWVGPAAELPQRIPGVVDDIVDVDYVENLGGGLVTPGLIDAHTHPVYAGNRWAEIAMRSNGSSTAEINQAFEVAVRRDPANWFWVHKRWKPFRSRSKNKRQMEAQHSKEIDKCDI